jgi:uncharacterized protein (TIGR02466 family)
MDCELIEFFPEVCGIYTYPEEKRQIVHDLSWEVMKSIGPDDPEYNKNHADSSLRHYFNNSNSSLLNYSEDFNDFKSWLLECAHHFMTQVHNYVIEDDNEVLITDCWLNRCVERSGQVLHNHHNCLISGTYYVNKEEWVHSGLDFQKRKHEGHPYLSHIKDWNNPNKYCRLIENIQPKTGDLLLWASHLPHGYEGATNFWTDRISISMNFMPRRIDNGKYSFTIQDNS